MYLHGEPCMLPVWLVTLPAAFDHDWAFFVFD